MSTTPSEPLSLEDQCLLHLVCHLEEYPPETLALLPLHLRHRLLVNLPAADVCQPAVSAGIDMEHHLKGCNSYTLPLPQGGHCLQGGGGGCACTLRLQLVSLISFAALRNLALSMALKDKLQSKDTVFHVPGVFARVSCSKSRKYFDAERHTYG